MSLSSNINQKGFSAFEALIIALILAIIGGTGYYVYNANKKASDTLAKASQETKSSTQKTVAKKAKSTTTPATQYLVFKEWGVRMKLATNMSDAYYEFLPNETGTAYLSTASLVALAPACAPTSTSMGAMFRQTVADYQTAIANPSDANAPGNIKIGDYYYGFISAQADCFDASNTAAQALYDSVQPHTGFVTAEKTLEAVPVN